MSTPNKRKEAMEGNNNSKKSKTECSYRENCFRLNPLHFADYSHAHLESMLDNYTGSGEFPIPYRLHAHRTVYSDQLKMILRKGYYTPGRNFEPGPSGSQSSSNSAGASGSGASRENRVINSGVDSKANILSSRGPDYVPLVPPTRRPENYMTVVRPRGQMAAKHAAAAPYYIFYTTIKDSPETHTQPYSITFQEILDESFGELKASLQINFIVEVGWLLAHYYFAGYRDKKMTILYGEETPDLKTISTKRPNIDAHHVEMPSPFGTHHSKMMILCYEDGSLRIVVSTANLYFDDWENRTQGLWISPVCPLLPKGASALDGESRTLFKRHLLQYLIYYHKAYVLYYLEKVKKCDFSDINVFLLNSVPGTHMDHDWGLLRLGSLLRHHVEPCPPAPVIAQASSLGSFGNEPRSWLCGDFLNNLGKSKNMASVMNGPPELMVIYPSLENVRQSHDNLLGGGCLPYAANVHQKQPWLNQFLHQWVANGTARTRAMPHIKTYMRVHENKALYFVLTSANISKAAWGSVNKTNGGLKVMSYETGVVFLPKFVNNGVNFPLEPGAENRLILPYDLPPVKYTPDMSIWVSDYLR